MSPTPSDGPRTLDRLHARIRACTKCVAAGYLEHARPIVAGSIRDRIAIVGQAPGAVELTTGQPFSGRPGAELRRCIAVVERSGASRASKEGPRACPSCGARY